MTQRRAQQKARGDPPAGAAAHQAGDGVEPQSQVTLQMRTSLHRELARRAFESAMPTSSLAAMTIRRAMKRMSSPA